MAIKQKSKSLLSRQNELSDSFLQLKVLQGQELQATQFPNFADKLAESGLPVLQAASIDILQLNITKKCNQSCAHCHVDAGPDRTEMMSRAHLDRALALAVEHKIATIDITGGAPELHPYFREFVAAATAAGIKIMNRCNLTIIVANPKYNDLPQFFAQNKVHIVSSLPHYSANRTDSQRGEGVFEDSIKALQMLNTVGYGQENSGLQLDLVYNPSGAFLPSSQSQLEADFKRQLLRKHQVVFNQLFAITNMPISRYLEYLLDSGNYKDYMTALVEAFNPAAVAGVMCRNMISVGHDGSLYDCDFNQMLDLKLIDAQPHLDSFDFDTLKNRRIVVNQHCYGCTAGAGSSCGGTVT
jgi:radical SAM/Cys-rich protein